MVVLRQENSLLQPTIRDDLTLVVVQVGEGTRREGAHALHN